MGEPEHLRATYNEIHNIIKRSAEKIAEFKPNMLIAIGACVRAAAAAADCWRWLIDDMHMHGGALPGGGSVTPCFGPS